MRKRDFAARPTGRAAFAFGSLAFYAIHPPRTAVVVSKKVSKIAPTRRRIQRRVRHAIRPLLPSLTMSVVVYPSKAALSAPFSSLTQSLAKALEPRYNGTA